jgi:hypothetical protein
MSPRKEARKATQSAAMPSVPLFSPTQRPDEPVTAGAPFGPGDGPAMQLPMQRQKSQISSTLSMAAQYSKDNTLSRIAEILSRRGM